MVGLLAWLTGILGCDRRTSPPASSSEAGKVVFGVDSETGEVVHVGPFDDSAARQKIDRLLRGRTLVELSDEELVELASCYNHALDEERALEAIEQVHESRLGDLPGAVSLKLLCLANRYADEPGGEHEIAFLNRCIEQKIGNLAERYVELACVHGRLATEYVAGPGGDFTRRVSDEDAYARMIACLRKARAIEPDLLANEDFSWTLLENSIESGGLADFAQTSRYREVIGLPAKR